MNCEAGVTILIEGNVFELTYSEDSASFSITLKDFSSNLKYTTIYSCGQMSTQQGAQVHSDSIRQLFNSLYHDRQVTCYSFGSVFNQGGHRRFKIDLGGTLTLYILKFDQHLSLFREVETVLRLDQTGSLEEQDLQAHQIMLSIAEFNRGINESMVGSVHQSATQMLQNLERENRLLKDKIKDIEEVNFKITSQLATAKEHAQALELRIEALQQEKALQMKMVRNQFEERLRSKQQAIKATNKINKDLKKQIQDLQQQKVSFVRMVLGQNRVSEGLLPQRQISLLMQSPYSIYFEVNGREIKKIDNQRGWCQILFHAPKDNKKIYTFSLTIQKTHGRYIGIGVVKSSRVRERMSHTSEQAMCYFGNNGKKYPSNIEQGQGFKEGERVDVRVDRVSSVVEWCINGTVRAQQRHSMLREDVAFVPYVEMGHRLDVVVWEGFDLV